MKEKNLSEMLRPYVLKYAVMRDNARAEALAAKSYKDLSRAIDRLRWAERMTALLVRLSMRSNEITSEGR